ncbi:MAG: MATE family efflux transporter [Prevotella sp.]|nr:MATE family efflux transporter [Prevotella sp.]
MRGLFWSMAVPVILQQLLIWLDNVIDRIWIAHIPDIGQLAFTASAVCVPIVYMMMALSELTGTGIAPQVGYHLGQGNRQRAEQTLGSFFLFNMLLAVVVCVVIEWQCTPLIRLFGGSDQTEALSEIYLRISTPGNALCILSGGLAPFLLAQGRSKEAGIVIGSGIVLNMLLDPLLIFGFDMGLAGAAWATTIAETFAALLAIAYLRRPGDIQLRLQHLRLRWDLIAPCLALGVTPMVMMLAETVQMGVYNRTLYAMVGDVGVGTMALVIMLYNFFYFPFYGMAFGVQSVTSYNLGANRWDRVRENIRMLMKVTLVWSLAVWLLMMLCTKPIVQLTIGDGTMTDYAVPMVRLSFVVFFIATLQFACQSTLQAMNRPVITFWIGLSRTLLLLIPLVWLLPMLLPGRADAGVFLAKPVTDVLVCIFTGIYLYRCLSKME